MRLPPDKARSDLAKENAKTVKARAFAKAEAGLAHWAVCLIGYAGPVPRPHPSNQMCWPVRFAMTKDPKEITKKTDLEQPLYPVVVLEYVWTHSDAHAKRLKAKLDEYLLGRDENAALRHGWRDLDDPLRCWPVLIECALAELRRGREVVEVFDEATHQKKVRRAAVGGRFS